MSWDDDDSNQAAEQRRKRQEMFTTIDKALAAAIISGLSITNLLGLTHVTGDTANVISIGLSALAPLAVLLVPNKPKV
jgi:hypothetical protein